MMMITERFQWEFFLQKALRNINFFCMLDFFFLSFFPSPSSSSSPPFLLLYLFISLLAKNSMSLVIHNSTMCFHFIFLSSVVGREIFSHLFSPFFPSFYSWRNWHLMIGSERKERGLIKWSGMGFCCCFFICRSGTKCK